MSGNFKVINDLNDIILPYDCNLNLINRHYFTIQQDIVTLLQDYIGYSSIIWRFKNIYFTNDLYNIHTNFFNEFIFLKNKALYNITLKHISFQCNMSIFYKLLFIFLNFLIIFYYY